MRSPSSIINVHFLLRFSFCYKEVRSLFHRYSEMIRLLMQLVRYFLMNSLLLMKWFPFRATSNDNAEKICPKLKLLWKRFCAFFFFISFANSKMADMKRGTFKRRRWLFLPNYRLLVILGAIATDDTNIFSLAPFGCCSSQSFVLFTT